MKITHSNTVIFVLMITSQHARITHCTGGTDDNSFTVRSSSSQVKLLELFPSRKEDCAVVTNQTQRKGKEVLTHDGTFLGKGTSAEATSRDHESDKEKEYSKPPGYFRYTKEMNDALLYLYYRNFRRRTKNWNEIQDIFYKKYRKRFSVNALREHFTALINMMVYNKRRIKGGKIANDPRIDMIRIYYQTRDGGELGHKERMHERWLQENPKCRKVPFSNAKLYVEERLRRIMKSESELRKADLPAQSHHEIQERQDVRDRSSKFSEDQHHSPRSNQLDLDLRLNSFDSATNRDKE